MRRVLMIIAVVFVMLVLTAGLAGASIEGPESRRIDTSNVNQPTDIKAVAEDAAAGREAKTQEHEAEAEEGRGAKDEAKLKAEGEENREGEEEAHQPAWMIPGWQSIFTVLAVIYFGLGVTLLPFIMAKEEH